MPKKRPEYRQSRKHSDFLQKIKYHIPSLPLFTDTLVQQLRTVYDEVQVLSVDEVLAIEQDVFQQHPSFQARTKLEVV